MYDLFENCYQIKNEYTLPLRNDLSSQIELKIYHLFKYKCSKLNSTDLLFKT